MPLLKKGSNKRPLKRRLVVMPKEKRRIRLAGIKANSSAIRQLGLNLFALLNKVYEKNAPLSRKEITQAKTLIKSLQQKSITFHRQSICCEKIFDEAKISGIRHNALAPIDAIVSMWSAPKTRTFITDPELVRQFDDFTKTLENLERTRRLRKQLANAT